MRKIIPHIFSETGKLKQVLLGIATGLGAVPNEEECYDPKSKESVALGIFPKEADLIKEMSGVANILTRYGIEVFRPKNLDGVNQVFARDISFVLEDKFIVPRIIIDRRAELEGIEDLIASISDENILHLSTGERAEGGDCMPWRDHIFIGYTPDEDFDKFETARTNMSAVNAIKNLFPNKIVYPIALVKDDTDPRKGILHLDCCFQPIGINEAIIFKDGMANPEDAEYITSLFGEENLICVEREEFYNMFPNVFSIDEKTIVSNSSFARLNSELRTRGYTVEETPYSEVSKMGGLLRCSTMPLFRED
jgi:N-dimethylarginine dimethylaminohydrolase